MAPAHNGLQANKGYLALRASADRPPAATVSNSDESAWDPATGTPEIRGHDTDCTISSEPAPALAGPASPVSSDSRTPRPVGGKRTESEIVESVSGPYIPPRRRAAPVIASGAKRPSGRDDAGQGAKTQAWSGDRWGAMIVRRGRRGASDVATSRSHPGATASRASDREISTGSRSDPSFAWRSVARSHAKSRTTASRSPPSAGARRALLEFACLPRIIAGKRTRGIWR